MIYFYAKHDSIDTYWFTVFDLHIWFMPTCPAQLAIIYYLILLYNSVTLEARWTSIIHICSFPLTRKIFISISFVLFHPICKSCIVEHKSWTNMVQFATPKLMKANPCNAPFANTELDYSCFCGCICLPLG